jgi:hypothetical protein
MEREAQIGSVERAVLHLEGDFSYLDDRNDLVPAAGHIYLPAS